MENKRGSKIDPWGTPRRRMWYSTWSSVVSQAAKTPSCLVSFLWNSLWMSENNGPITVGGGVAWGSVETDCNWLCMARTCRLASTGEQEMLKVWVEVNLSLYICCLWHRDEQHVECYTSLLLFALIQSPVSPFMLFLLSHCSFSSPFSSSFLKVFSNNVFSRKSIVHDIKPSAGQIFHLSVKYLSVNKMICTDVPLAQRIHFGDHSTFFERYHQVSICDFL